jgi:negative regulator of sigma E activity
MLFSDGLANVSVFITSHMGDTEARRARVGASNSFSIAIDEFRITAVGEVPAETAEQIARSMQPK